MATVNGIITLKRENAQNLLNQVLKPISQEDIDWLASGAQTRAGWTQVEMDITFAEAREQMYNLEKNPEFILSDIERIQVMNLLGIQADLKYLRNPKLMQKALKAL